MGGFDEISGKTGEPPEADEGDHRHGHRERLKERFRAGGAEALPDYELLELLLFRTIPRRDVKGLAKALIRRFGSFAEVLGAPEERLKETPGVGEAVVTDLKLVRAAGLRMARGEVKKKTVLSSWTQVIDYCRSAMAFETREEFRILFLDKRNGLVADEIQQRGTIDHTPVYPRSEEHTSELQSH